MNDNTTPHRAVEYDENIIKTIPFYEHFHTETINLVKTHNNQCNNWIDIGCGTGTFVERAYEIFSKTKFILSDFSEDMLEQARNKFAEYPSNRIALLPKCSSQEINKYYTNKVDVITSIQVHHYLSKEDRQKATKNCYELLGENGIYITFENIKPLSQEGVQIGLDRWGNYQEAMGKNKEEVESHKSRFNKDYFPITILEHFDILKNVGFKTYEVFWLSNMQSGFYAIK